MLSILTGLPVNKQNDKLFVQQFINTDAAKVICGSSTMKMFCRIQNITPEIKTVFEKNIPVAKYKIENIYLATEGVITLNECYKYLVGDKIENSDAVKLGDLLIEKQTINVFVGLSQNKDGSNYKNFGLLTRIEIVNKIVDFLKQKNKTVNIFRL